MVVAPQFDKARETKVLPLTGVVSPRTENTIETGVGYSTDVGPRVKATWKKPWMNSYGHSLTTSTSISAPEQILDFSYKMPLLKNPLDVMFVVGGYNSSNTTHLVDIAKEHVPTYFIESAECIKSIQYVDAFDTKTREVRRMTTEPVVQNLGKSLKVGITAGASCPANLIEATILRIADLRK